jgi:hypothetical protein
MKTAAATFMFAASLVGVVAPASAPAHADCGDPGQDPCTGPVPTVDEVVGIMQQLTDPNIPAANKGNIVTPGFAPDEAATVDDHLHRMDGYTLPLNFIVTNIQPAPGNFAGATVATNGRIGLRSWSPPGTIVLANVGGHWELTHRSAMSALDAYWYNTVRPVV